MLIALSQPDQEGLQLNVNITATLGISAEEARRKVVRYFMDEVSLFIMPATPPLLIIATEDRIFWRFPLVFPLGRRGRLGQVGDVDVDAYSGELLLDADQIAEISAHAERLAATPAHLHSIAS